MVSVFNDTCLKACLQNNIISNKFLFFSIILSQNRYDNSLLWNSNSYLSNKGYWLLTHSMTISNVCFDHLWIILGVISLKFKFKSSILIKIRPLANSKTKNNHIIVRWRSSLKDPIWDRKNNYRKWKSNYSEAMHLKSQK